MSVDEKKSTRRSFDELLASGAFELTADEQAAYDAMRSNAIRSEPAPAGNAGFVAPDMPRHVSGDIAYREAASGYFWGEVARYLGTTIIETIRAAKTYALESGQEWPISRLKNPRWPQYKLPNWYARAAPELRVALEVCAKASGRSLSEEYVHFKRPEPKSGFDRLRT